MQVRLFFAFLSIALLVNLNLWPHVLSAKSVATFNSIANVLDDLSCGME